MFLKYGVRVRTGETIEPVTLEEARVWCKVDPDDTTDDAMLLLLISAARERAEDLTGMCIARRQLEWRIDRLPDGGAPLEVPYPPLISLDYITYLDTAGDSQTLSGSPDPWILEDKDLPARVTPLYGQSWPATRNQIGSVLVGFTAGYTTNAKMPASLKLWIQQRICTWASFRETLTMKGVSELPRDYVDGLLDSLRLGRFFA